MDGVKPGHANSILGRGRGNLWQLASGPEQQMETGRSGTELTLRGEPEVHLQAALQQKHAVHGATKGNVQMMNRPVLVHPRRPVGEHRRKIRAGMKAEQKVDVRPAILKAGSGRAGKRRSLNARVRAASGHELGAKLVTFFGRKHVQVRRFKYRGLALRFSGATCEFRTSGEASRSVGSRFENRAPGVARIAERLSRGPAELPSLQSCFRYRPAVRLQRGSTRSAVIGALSREKIGSGQTPQGLAKTPHRDG